MPAALHLEIANPDLRDLFATVQRSLDGTDVYLVGGAVRDLLRGKTPFDIDLAVAGDAHAAAERLAGDLDGHPFHLDLERGQYRIALSGDAGARAGVEVVDIAPLKGGIEADLRQRDFTVDAMAARLLPGGLLEDVIDPLGGAADLDAGVIRMVAEANLLADPLRLLRAVRLAVELRFDIEVETRDAITRLSVLLTQAAPERQRDELCRIFATPRAAGGVRLLDGLGLLDQLVPELTPAHGCDQPVVHYWDVFDHSVETVAMLDLLLDQGNEEIADPRDRLNRRLFYETLAWEPLNEYLNQRAGAQSRRVLLKLAGLLHDVAKPETKTFEPNGRVRFFGHPEIGARKAEAICQRLRFSRQEGKFVANLVEEHLRPTQLSPGGPPSQRAIYRFFRDLDDAGPACLVLTLADASAAMGPRMTHERWQGMVAFMADVLARGGQQAERAARGRLITGGDLMAELGLHQGPLIGELLAPVDEAIATGELGSRAEALAYAKRLLDERRALSTPETGAGHE